MVRHQNAATTSHAPVHIPNFLCTIASDPQNMALLMLGDIYVSMYAWATLQSYHHQSTRSHQNSEVKRGWARLVLG
eukprot:jgi/Chrzof1/1508/Cz10g10130.t1